MQYPFQEPSSDEMLSVCFHKSQRPSWIKVKPLCSPEPYSFPSLVYTLAPWSLQTLYLFATSLVLEASPHSPGIKEALWRIRPQQGSGCRQAADPMLTDHVPSLFFQSLLSQHFQRNVFAWWLLIKKYKGKWCVTESPLSPNFLIESRLERWRVSCWGHFLHRAGFRFQYPHGDSQPVTPGPGI